MNKPGRNKRAILDAALDNYTLAFNWVLKKAYEDIENIEQNYKNTKGTYTALKLSKWVGKDLSKKMNGFDVEPFKDSLKLDMGMVLAGYFAKRNNFAGCGFPNFEYASDRKRPIYFCRYDTKRSYSLLYDIDNKKYYAKLYLLNSRNALSVEEKATKREVKYISSREEYLERKAKKETFIILPLSFGKWHEKILETALKKPEILRTARLIKKKDEYFLSISVDLPCNEKIESTTYMGVSRGIDNCINYSVVDHEGSIIEEGAINTDGKNKISSLHIAANNIAGIALRNKSEVIVQNLTEKGDRLSWDGETKARPRYGCKTYNRFVNLLEYKLPQMGLPDAVKVSSVDIFQTCPLCGCNTKRNRFSEKLFICTTCGYTGKIESLGSYNLSTKLIKYSKLPVKITVRKEKGGIRLSNSIIGLDLFIPGSEKDNFYVKIQGEIMDFADKIYEQQKSSAISPEVIRMVEKIRGKHIIIFDVK
jgi:putative transposase